MVLGLYLLVDLVLDLDLYLEDLDLEGVRLLLYLEEDRLLEDRFLYLEDRLLDLEGRVYLEDLLEDLLLEDLEDLDLEYLEDLFLEYLEGLVLEDLEYLVDLLDLDLLDLNRDDLERELRLLANAAALPAFLAARL